MNTTSSNSPDDLCRACRTGRVAIVQTEGLHRDADLTVAYPDEFSRCESCGDEFYTTEQSMSRSRAITNAIRKARGLMTGDEIRAARVRLGLSLPQFERAMGVGQKTIGRWERGTVPPTGAANVGLWLAANDPIRFLEWASTRGVVVDKRLSSSSAAAAVSTSQGPTLTLVDGGMSGARETASIRTRATPNKSGPAPAAASEFA